MKDSCMKNTILFTNKDFFSAVKEEIAEGLTLRIKPKGESMTPFIVAGRDEIILSMPCECSFRRGSILLAEIGADRQVAHRVLRVDGEIVTLRGDGNLVLTEQCCRSDVIAEVVAIVRKGKKIKKGSLRWTLFSYLWPSSPLLRRVLLKIYYLYNRGKEAENS